jgi:hypothetical protein
LLLKSRIKHHTEGRTMRPLLLAAALLLAPLSDAEAQVSIGIDIGIRVPTYPELVLVPGYPVYYDQNASTNYFFYDGLYWVFEGDRWYASSWYDGPWQWVEPEGVPLYVLRVPVRYYRRPPAYFRGWRHDAPPRWGQHWGRGWERRRSGWDRWDRRAAPRAAPLPVYQREYYGDRYPRAIERQHALRSEHDRYRPRDAETRRHLQPVRGTYPARHDDRRGPNDHDRANPPGREDHYRGDRDDRRGDRDDRRGDRDDRRADHEDRRGGRDDRSDDRRGDHDDRRGGREDRHGDRGERGDRDDRHGERGPPHR